MDDFLLLFGREVGERVIFERSFLVVAVLAVFKVGDLLGFGVLVCRDGGLHVRHDGRVRKRVVG